MCEILVAARNLDSGYRRGDPITVQRNGHPWGREEGLPNFVVVKIPGLSVERAKEFVDPGFWEPAEFGDPEFNAPDVEDRRVKRHRRKVRIFWQEAPAAILQELATTGEVTVTVNQVRNYVRRLRYNRQTREVEDSGELELPSGRRN